MKLVRRSVLAREFGLTPPGFSKMASKAQGFPKAIKTGDAKQAAVFYDRQEVDAWINQRKEQASGA